MSIVLIDEVPTEVGNGADEIIRLRNDNAQLRDALTTIVDAQPKISAIELQVFARNVLKGIEK